MPSLRSMVKFGTCDVVFAPRVPFRMDYSYCSYFHVVDGSMI